MLLEREILLSEPQFELVTCEERFPAFVAGFGSGKTEALIKRALLLKFQNLDNDIGYYLPTYDLVSTIAFPRFEEALEEMHIPYKSRTGNKPRIMVEGAASILFRTMDNPARIVGYEVGDSLVDELDTLKEADAKLVWQKIVSRNRQKKANGKHNTIAVGTTPEGFRFVYNTWKKEPPSSEYRIIRASTYSNERNLPENYIKDLLDLYPTNLIAAYIDGEFVNLASGSVYPDFDRALNASSETIQGNETLHIGLDFNVTKMAFVVFVNRDGFPHAVTEATGLYDTPATIEAIKRRFPNNPVMVYPDASGDNRKSNNASESDISLLKKAKFIVCNNPANPRVKDRVMSMNRLIHADNKRRLKVNIEACPNLATSLEQQAYDKNGEPDKTSGLDHIVDAAGYFVAYRFPIRRRNASHIQITGV
jgi:hypothetical protein